MIFPDLTLQIGWILRFCNLLTYELVTYEYIETNHRAWHIYVNYS